MRGAGKQLCASPQPLTCIVPIDGGRAHVPHAFCKEMRENGLRARASTRRITARDIPRPGHNKNLCPQNLGAELGIESKKKHF